MNRIDANCLVGNWPFRRLGRHTMDDLLQVHKGNGISGGCVASLNSIFYNDPLEGEEELHQALQNAPGYRHIMTVNPALSCGTADIARCRRLYPVAGVRIYPGYHGYRLQSPCMEALCAELETQRLPLFLTMRMEDERLDYLITPRILPTDEISAFLSAHPGLTVVLLNLRMDELERCREAIQAAPRVFFDTSGLKDGQFNVERLTAGPIGGRLLYGSLFPLYCLKSTCLQVEKADIPPQSRERIFRGNCAAALGG